MRSRVSRRSSFSITADNSIWCWLTEKRSFLQDLSVHYGALHILSSQFFICWFPLFHLQAPPEKICPQGIWIASRNYVNRPWKLKTERKHLFNKKVSYRCFVLCFRIPVCQNKLLHALFIIVSINVAYFSIIFIRSYPKKCIITKNVCYYASYLYQNIHVFIVYLL